MQEIYCKVFSTYVTLYNSYTVKSIKKMKNAIRTIPTLLDHRNMFSCLNEWRAHNLLYTLGIYKIHTMHTDFDYNNKWYEEIVFFILSLLYFKW